MARVVFFKKLALLLGDMLFFASVIILLNWIRAEDFGFIRETPIPSVFFLLFFVVCMYITDLYNLEETYKPWNYLTRIVVSTLAGTLFFYFLHSNQVPFSFFGAQFILFLLTIIAWRRIFHYIQTKVKKRGVLIVGAETRGLAVYRFIKDMHFPFEVKGFLDDDPAKQKKVMGSPAVLGIVQDLPRIVRDHKISTVVSTISHDESPDLSLKLSKAGLLRILIETHSVYEQLAQKIPIEFIHNLFIQRRIRYNKVRKIYLDLFKRIFDLISSLALILLTFPILLLIVFLIKLDSPGPIVFKQRRVGKNGKYFSMWKFRSMVQDAEPNGAVWAKEDDPRVTRVGKYIRKLRLDESPQFYNVLKGEMSLIGPRPERPDLVKKLDDIFPDYSLRHIIKPGITGWAQVKYPYGASKKDSLAKLEYDMYYLKNLSILLDIKIFLKTIGVVLFGKGAR